MPTDVNNSLNCSESEKDDSWSIGRRNFIKSSSLALLAGTFVQPAAALANTNFSFAQKASPKHTVDLTTTYTVEELERLYVRVDTRSTSNITSKKNSAVMSFAPSSPFRDEERNTEQKLFFYDQAAGKLVNPFNIKPSLTAAKYSFEATALNYHVTKEDNNKLWKSLKNLAQMQLGLSVPANASDDLTWLVMTGIDLFLGNNREGADRRLRKFLNNNKLTDQFVRNIEKIDITSGVGDFQLQVFGQKKKSIWQTILATAGTLFNSTIFATLPIPRLVPQGLKFAESVINMIQKTDEDNQLEPIWQGARIPFKLYEGAAPVEARPFTFKPGLWLSVDRTFADKNLDGNKNMINHFIDIPGGFNELVDSNNRPVDANYTILKFEFPKIA